MSDSTSRYVQTISNKELMIAKVRRYKGPIYVTCLAKNDVYHVRVSKPEALAHLERISSGELEVAVYTDHLCIDAGS